MAYGSFAFATPTHSTVTVRLSNIFIRVMVSEDVGQEDRLLAHIREKLLDYALTHLTENYITFTQDAVVHLLSEYLHQIPVTESSSLILPVDPFEHLSQSFALNGSEPYDETWTTDRDAIDHIKSLLHLSGGLKTETCWNDEELSCHDLYDYKIYRPMSPILTTCARRETPQLGSKKFPVLTYTQLASNLVQAVEVEQFQDPPVPDVADTIDFMLTIPAEDRSEVVSILRPITNRIEPTYLNRHQNAFLRSSSPATLPPRNESPFMPLFPRGRMPGRANVPIHHRASMGLASVSALPSLLPDMKVEDAEADLLDEHMRVVDGWQTYAPSSPSSHSVQSSPDDQLDELFAHSSPDTDPVPLQRLMMEEVQFPRANTLGGARASPKPLGGGERLGTFLQTFLTVAPTTSSRPRSPLPPSSPQSLSMIGQPCTSIGYGPASNDKANITLNEEDDLDTAIGATYQCLKTWEPEDLILLETLDVKDACLMDVPILPSPNDHPPNQSFMPDNLRVLVALSQDRNKVSTKAETTRSFLTMVKGIKSLNLELSWIPFKSELKTLTNEELANVLDFSVDHNIDVSRQLEQATGVEDLTESHTQSYTSWLSFDDSSPELKPRAFSFSQDVSKMILTREERQRSSKMGNVRILESDQPGDWDENGHSDDDLTGNRDKNHSISSQKTLESVDQILRQYDRNQLQGAPDSSNTFLHASDQSLHAACGCANCSNHSVVRIASPCVQNIDSMLDPSYFSFSSDAGDLNVNGKRPRLQTPLGPEPARTMLCTSNAKLDHVLDAGRTSSLCYEPTFVGTFQRNNYAILDGSTVLPIADLVAEDDFGDQAGSQTSRRHNATTWSPLPSVESRTISGSPLVESPIPIRPLGATGFALLRGKRVNEHESHISRVEDEIRLSEPEPEPEPGPAPPAIPQGLYDRTTLSLPCPFTPPITVHRYLSSLGLVQKQALVRCLRAESCLVDLVEDDNLSDVDLILDPHSAVLFMSLSFLPSQCDSLVAKLCQLSWRYSQLLLVFEAYSTSRSYLPDDERSDGLKISYYSPPVVKAVKKLRRNLGVSEACDTKNAACGINLAFANSVNEAGMFARYFGNLVEASAVHSAIWGDREWLEGAMDEDENEHDLASLEGMNAFAARVILSQMSLQAFLDLSPGTRVKMFGLLIGEWKIGLVNRVLEERLRLIQSVESESECMTDLDGSTDVFGERTVHP